jgi:hypothetical protein
MLPLLVYSFWSVLIQSSLEISLGGNKVHAHRLKLPDQKCAMDRTQRQISMKVLTSSRAVRKIREALLLSGLSGKICHHHYKHKPP